MVAEAARDYWLLVEFVCRKKPLWPVDAEECGCTYRSKRTCRTKASTSYASVRQARHVVAIDNCGISRR